MPIDPRIALDVQQAPVLSPLQAQSDQLKVQDQQQTTQANALKLQQAQRDAQASQMLDAAYAKHFQNGTLDLPGLLNDIAQQPGGGHLVPIIQQNQAKVQQSLADATEAQGKAEAAQRDYAGRLGAELKAGLDAIPADADPQTRQHMLENIAGLGVTRIRQAGGLIPQGDAIAMVQALDPSNEAGMRATVDRMLAASPEQAKLKNESLTAGARAQAAVTGAQRLQAELPGLAAQATIRQQEATGTQPMSPYQQQELAVRRGELGVARARESREAAQAGGATGAVAGVQAVDPNAPHGDTYLATLPPNQQAMIKSLAEGRQPWPSSFALRTPYWADLVNKVLQYDPSLDLAQINNNARSKVRSDFTSGKSAQQVNAINTTIGHIADLKALGDQLGNSSMDWVNAAMNLVTPGGTQRGQTINSFNLAKQAVASELTRVYRQAGGSEKDIQEWQASINAAKSPGELQSAWKTIGNLLESKLNALQEQYKQGMGISDIQMVSPKARVALNALEGISGSRSSSTAPTVGERRLINGRLGEWDGKGWKAVAGQ